MEIGASVRIAILGIAVVCLAGCSKPDAKEGGSEANPPGATKYVIEKKGIVVESDRRVYEALGDVTFSRTQNYKIKLADNGEKKDRILFLRVVVRVGGQDKNDYQAMVLVQNGEGEMSCSHRYDVKVVKADEAVDPECKITPLGDAHLYPVSAVFR